MAEPVRRKTSRPAAKHRNILNENRHLYPIMLERQNGGCAICGRLPKPTRRLDMDHDHREMYIRGLLCVRCNRALVAWMTPKWLRSSADYLEQALVRHNANLNITSEMENNVC